MKEITKRLGAVDATRLKEWGPRDLTDVSGDLVSFYPDRLTECLEVTEYLSSSRTRLPELSLTFSLTISQMQTNATKNKPITATCSISLIIRRNAHRINPHRPDLLHFVVFPATSRHSSTAPATSTHLQPTGEVEPWTVNVEPPTASEVYDRLRSLKRHRAPGPDDLPPALFKDGGEVLSQRLSDLFGCIWEKESVPDNWEESVIVPIFKKGARSECGNHRGISLTPVVTRLLASIVIRRLTVAREILTREQQAGFRSGRGCVDQIFTLRQRLMETGEPSGWVRQLPPAAMKEPLGAKNGNMCPYSSTDESEILHRNIFPLQSQRLPRDSLKFILTVWYSPETSSAIAESISTCCTEVQLKKLITGSPRDVLRLAEKYFEELDI
ncbi:hypothetical protein T265_01226 [Opisthorchis viverrini]|uniref:Reverse transcriptase domain-containing protein n=1 Tax=Opisthorchis viverrini TaxID=6198 RepID=A0A074ZZ76_OPIVI|nr:hypothetical protein T265_01226 [Opisthorchis viverrini]KER32738.1 hypothetical protein T265_01226 [Opisthorchis viverrini]